MGRNQATVFPTTLASHDEFVASPFDPKQGRDLYLRARGGDGTMSPTRRNINHLTDLLAQRGVRDVLETNVICYSTKMSADLARREHTRGRERGRAIFQKLLDRLRPQVLIVHRDAARKDLARALRVALPKPAPQPGPPRFLSATVAGADGHFGLEVVLLRSLAPPEWNKWSRWAEPHLAQVAEVVARTSVVE